MRMNKWAYYLMVGIVIAVLNGLIGGTISGFLPDIDLQLFSLSGAVINGLMVFLAVWILGMFKVNMK